jgi:mono/diheme cytochrome c family protein
MTWLRSLTLPFILFATACAAGPDATSGAARLPPEASLVSAGRTVAVMRCSHCHALDSFSRSPNPSAPRMSQLLDRYGDRMLANSLIDGIRIGHDTMPEFILPDQEAEALVAYLRSIR